MHENRESERQLQPIQYWFIIRTIPWGTQPQVIKKQWLDIPLPCRRPIEGQVPDEELDINTGLQTLTLIESEVLIDANDAIKALMLFDRADAGSWWNNRFDGSNQTLVFQASEGQVLSMDEAERVLPGINEFDEYVYWL